MKQEMSKLELKWQEQVRILKKSTEIELDMKTNLIEEQQRYVGYRIYPSDTGYITYLAIIISLNMFVLLQNY